MKNEKVIIFDFGSQYTQLIARRVRELNIYSEIHPFSKDVKIDDSVRAIILSGSPYSVREDNAPMPSLDCLNQDIPVLAICYGAQFLAHNNGGTVSPSKIREYGRANLSFFDSNSRLFKGISSNSQVWMSHGDTITNIPESFKLIASTKEVDIAAYSIDKKNVFGLQFHPEVYHSKDGQKIISNFLINICNCKQDWTPDSFIDSTVNNLKSKIGNAKVVLGLSGGVDSTVAAVLLDKAIGKNLYCIFVDNGLLRKNEFDEVLDQYLHMGLNVKGVDAKDEFYSVLNGVSEPEKKRKAIGSKFIDVFDNEAALIKNVKWLAQGTIDRKSVV